MGTDAVTPYNLHGGNCSEIKHMTDLGISNKDALIISTSNAAKLMKLEDRGTICEGNFADLLVVDGNPVEDISVVSENTKHIIVMKNGKTIDLD